MTHRTALQREPDFKEAQEAASRGADALGDAGVPFRTLTRWGEAAWEIAQQAGESHTDVVVVGAANQPDSKAGLGHTAQQTLLETTRSVMLARPAPADEVASVVVLYSSQRLFTRAIEMLQALRLDPRVPIYLVAMLRPVKPFGSMFVSLNEAIRLKEQVAHDAHAEVLGLHLADVAARLLDGELRTTRTIVRDVEPGELTAVLKELLSGLVIVGDSAYGNKLDDHRRMLDGLFSNAPCSVLVAR